MSPRVRTKLDKTQRFPRSRGDEPSLINNIPETFLFSPLTRG